MKRYAIGAAAVSAALFSSWKPVHQTQPAVLRPNIVVIVLDDTGNEKLSCYSPLVATPPTPELDAIAASGVRFTNCYGNPLCSPTRASIMTGRYSFRTGMGTLSTSYQLPLAEETIADVLKQGFPGQPQQYKCGAFGKWHMTFGTDYMHAVNQGFDDFIGPMANLGNHFDWNMVRADPSGFALPHVGSPTGPFDETTFSASVVRQEASAWIAAAPQPFFAYVCFNPPHHPFQVPPLTLLSPATQSTINGLGFTAGQNLSGTANARLAFDWMIEAVDTEIGRLIDGMSPSKRLNTTFLIVGDNGTPGSVIEEPPFDDAHAKGSVFEQGTLVPLLAKGRDVSNAGLACSGLVNTVDVWRTVAALAGAQLPTGVTFDGVSFKGMLANPSNPSGRTQAFVQLYNPNGPYVPDPNNPPPGVAQNSRALNDGQFKYIRRYTPPFEQAFDIVNDPLELNDLFPGIAPPYDATELQILGLQSSLVTLSGF